MKKYSRFVILIVMLLGATHLAYACQTNNDCPGLGICNIATGVCETPVNPTGIVSSGCTNNNQCPGNQCNLQTGVCISSGNPTGAAPQPTAAPATQAQPGAASPGVATSNFVPLTALPGLSNITGNSINFIGLFNNLYKICIGAAAALALIMIMWGGFTWMTAGDSPQKVSQARTRIQNAVFGLILVLSPVIVFGIINPNILSLHLDVSSLTPSPPTGASTGTGATANPGAASASAVDNNANGIQEGNSCSTANGSDGNCAGNLICTNNICQTDPQLDNGTGAAGQPCQPASSNCSAGLICDTTDTCSAPTSGIDSGFGTGNGTVSQNNDCQTSADCQGDLVCDALSDTCQPVGSGTYTCDDDTIPDPTTGQCADGTYPGPN